MGKATGAGLIVAGVAVLVGAYLLPHQKAGPVDHEPIPIPGDIADAYGPLSVGSWRLHRVKAENQSSSLSRPIDDPRRRSKFLPSTRTTKSRSHASCNGAEASRLLPQRIN